MKKFTLLFTLLIIIFSGNLYADGYVQVGMGTASTNNAFYGSYLNSWARSVYYQSEIGAAKTITQIAYDMTSTTSITMPNQKIYMKHTSATSMSVGYDDPIANGYTLVYNGSITLNAGWNTIDITDFSYNGTDNLIILVEDRDNISHYKNFNCTDYSGVVRVVIAGCDVNGCFPSTGATEPSVKATPNIRFYYPTTINPASTPIPAENSIRISVGADLKFTLDNTATTYDVYFGTSATPTTIIVSDAAAVNGLNTVAYSVLNSGNLLDSKTDYYWKVVAKNGANTISSAIFKFTTQKLISSFPYNQYFTQDNLDPNQVFYSGWYGDLSKTDWEYAATPSNWSCWQYQVGNPPETTDYYAYISPFSLAIGDSYSLITPRFGLGTSSYDVSFYWMNGDATPLPIGKTTGYDETYFEISTDNGVTWESTPLATLAPDVAQTQFQYVSLNISNKGNAVKFRWRYKLTGAASSAKKVFIDNFEVKAASNTAQIQLSQTDYTFQELSVGAHTSYTLDITNLSNAYPIVISSATATGQFSCDVNNLTIQPTQTSSVTINFTPSSSGYLNGQILFNIGTATGTNVITLHGSAVMPLLTFYENFDASVGNPAPVPEHWNSINSPTDQYSAVSIVNSSFDSYSQPYVAKILSLNDHVSPLILLTSGVTNFDQNKLTFYAKKGDVSYNMSLIVGVMDDPNDPQSFTQVKTFVLTENYAQYTVLSSDFPANNTKPYIAFKHGQDEATTISSLRIDDIEWQNDLPTAPLPATLIFPTDASNNYDIYKTALLQWGSGGGSPTQYNLFLGTDNPPTNMVNNLNMNAETTYEILTNLSYSQKYYWKVVPSNAYGSATDCPVWNFTTMADPTITSFPYTQNFDGVAATSGFNYPLGWALENANGDSFTWDIITNVATPTIVHSVPNAMHMIFGFSAMNDWMFTPPCIFDPSKIYTISFWYKVVGDAIVPNPIEKLSVFVGSDNNSASMQATPLYDNLNLTNLDWQQAEVTFIPTTRGTYFIGFQGHSDALMGLLIVDDITIKEVAQSSANDITAFTIPNQLGNSVINTTDKTVDINVLTGTNVTNVVPTIEISPLATISPLSTAAQNFVAPVQYTVTAEDATDAIWTVTVSFVDNIENIANNVSIYPNPANDYVTLKLDNLSENCNIVISDVLGKIVKRQNITSNSTSILINDFKSGIYFITIQNGNQIITEKILKN